MATVSNAGAGMSFSNAQQGTRGLSAGDWIRLQRLRQSRLYATQIATNQDVAPTQSNQINIHNSNGAIKVYPVVGTSKIRRPGSFWTDYQASQSADFVLSKQAGLNQTSVTNTVTRLCNCTPTTLSTKQGICTKCNQTTHVRIM